MSLPETTTPTPAPTEHLQKPKKMRCGTVGYACQGCGYQVELEVVAKTSSAAVPEKDAAVASKKRRTDKHKNPDRAPKERRLKKNPTEKKKRVHSKNRNNVKGSGGEHEGEHKGERKGEGKSEGKGCADTVGETAPSAVPDFPLRVKVEHLGYWITDAKGTHVATLDETCTTNNSVMLAPHTLLYVYKLAFRHLLLARGVLHLVDAANLVPHVRVRKDPKSGFSQFKAIQNRSFVLREEQLSAKSDFLIVELDEARDLHMTLVYSKKIEARLKRIGSSLLSAFKDTLHTLNRHPELVAQYSALPYFGEAAGAYWAAHPEGYPLNVTPDPGWTAPTVPDADSLLTELETTPAGSIIVPPPTSSSSSSSSSSSLHSLSVHSTTFPSPSSATLALA